MSLSMCNYETRLICVSVQCRQIARARLGYQVLLVSDRHAWVRWCQQFWWKSVEYAIAYVTFISDVLAFDNLALTIIILRIAIFIHLGMTTDFQDIYKGPNRYSTRRFIFIGVSLAPRNATEKQHSLVQFNLIYLLCDGESSFEQSWFSLWHSQNEVR